jgi:hypothetical protein
MATILVRIFLHGLIALVPTQGTNGSNHMTALLVDARANSRFAAVASRCVVPHTPKLIVRTSGSECFSAGCHILDELCQCVPEHQDIRIDQDPSPTPTILKGRPDSAMPASGDDARDFSYVANFANLNLSLASELRDGHLIPAVLDRMKFAFDSVSSCMLSTRARTDGTPEVHALSFGRLGDSATSPSSQAMAQMLVAKLNVPFDGNTQQVKLQLTSFDATAFHTLTLAPEPCELNSTEQCIDIYLSNERPDLLNGDPCDDGVARDFAFFYEFTANPPAWEERMVPHVDSTAPQSASSLEVHECTHHVKNPASRPICPMASFN